MTPLSNEYSVVFSLLYFLRVSLCTLVVGVTPYPESLGVRDHDTTGQWETVIMRSTF